MRRVLQNPLEAIKREAEKKMLGYFPMSFPEELAYACGIKPIRLLPYQRQPPVEADRSVQTFVCSVARAFWDEAVRGELSFLEGVVLPATCEAARYLHRAWSFNKPHRYVEALSIPYKSTGLAQKFVEKELMRVLRGLESIAGVEVGDQELSKAIELCNQNRRLLKKLYELRRSESPPISGADAYAAVCSGYVLDKAVYSELLKQAIEECFPRQASAKSGPRLMVVGGCLADDTLFKVAEDAGATVVVDDLNTGLRSFWWLVDESLPPLKALAKWTLEVLATPRAQVDKRFEHISKLIKEFRVDGVVFAINRYCIEEKFDLPWLSERIREDLGIPTTYVELEYLADVAPIRTRVEAFVESLVR